MKAVYTLSIGLLSCLVCWGEPLFPNAESVDPYVRIARHSKTCFAADGTLLVNGQPRHLLTAQIEKAHPWLWSKMKVPGARPELDWFYNQYPDYDYCQRVGFDSVSTKVPAYVLKRYSKTVSSPWLADTPTVRREQRQLWGSGLPFYVDITGFEWDSGALAYGWLGCKQSDIVPEARNTRYRTPFNRWAAYSFMHPAGREIYRQLWTDAVRFAQKFGTNVLAYELFNESGYNDPSPYNRRLFAEHLRRKYGRIEALNQVWKSSYDSFESASQFKDEREHLGLFVDWCTFMEDCAIDLCAFGQREILKLSPETHVTNQINGATMYRNVTLSNFNMYRMSKLLNGVTYPTGGANLQVDGLIREPDLTVDAPDFANLDKLPIYAYYKVLAEGKPLFNNENYAIRSSIINATWQDMIHHSCMTNYWSWSSGIMRLKKNDWNPAFMKVMAKKFPFDLLNPFAKSPEALAELPRVKKEIGLYGKYFLPRNRGVASEVAVLLSYPSSRRIGWKADLPDYHLMPLYVNALLFSHYLTDVIAEEHLAEGRSERYKVIVVSGVSNVLPGTVPRLMEYVRTGGILVMARGFMEHDEYDRPNRAWDRYPGFKVSAREAQAAMGYQALETSCRSSVLPGAIRGNMSLDAVLGDGWEVLGTCGGQGALFRKGFGKGWVYVLLPELRMYPLASVLGGLLERHGIVPQLRVGNESGVQLPPNVEVHVSKVDGKHAAFLFNYDSYPKLLTLMPGDIASAYDLIHRWELPKTKQGFLYYLPAQSRGVVTFGTLDHYREFAPFKAMSVEDLKTKRDEEQTARELARRAVKTLYKPDLTRTRTLDIRPYCNRDFIDAKANDGEGGWTDEGMAVGLQNVPLEPMLLEGVPCDIIRGDMNSYKTCIVLQSTHGNNGSLPRIVSGIPVGTRVKNLYFFHTAAWVEKGKEVLTYRIHYTNGRSLDVPIREGREIGDWYLPVVSVSAKKQIAWKNDLQQGFFVWKWKNPYPEEEVRSLDICSHCGKTIPIVLGITAEGVSHGTRTAVTTPEDFTGVFSLSAPYFERLKKSIFLEQRDRDGMRIRTLNSNSSFESRADHGEGTVSLELLNETQARVQLGVLHDKDESFEVQLDFIRNRGRLIARCGEKADITREIAVPVVPLNTWYVLSGTYEQGRIVFRLNGSTLGELPVDGERRGRIVFRVQSWWSRVCMRKITVP